MGNSSGSFCAHVDTKGPDPKLEVTTPLPPVINVEQAPADRKNEFGDTSKLKRRKSEENVAEEELIDPKVDETKQTDEQSPYELVPEQKNTSCHSYDSEDMGIPHTTHIGDNTEVSAMDAPTVTTLKHPTTVNPSQTLIRVEENNRLIPHHITSHRCDPPCIDLATTLVMGTQSTTSTIDEDIESLVTEALTDPPKGDVLPAASSTQLTVASVDQVPWKQPDASEANKNPYPVLNRSAPMKLPEVNEIMPIMYTALTVRNIETKRASILENISLLRSSSDSEITESPKFDCASQTTMSVRPLLVDQYTEGKCKGSNIGLVNEMTQDEASMYACAQESPIKSMKIVPKLDEDYGDTESTTLIREMTESADQSQKTLVANQKSSRRKSTPNKRLGKALEASKSIPLLHTQRRGSCGSPTQEQLTSDMTSNRQMVISTMDTTQNTLNRTLDSIVNERETPPRAPMTYVNQCVWFQNVDIRAQQPSITQSVSVQTDTMDVSKCKDELNVSSDGPYTIDRNLEGSISTPSLVERMYCQCTCDMKEKLMIVNSPVDNITSDETMEPSDVGVTKPQNHSIARNTTRKYAISSPLMQLIGSQTLCGMDQTNTLLPLSSNYLRVVQSTDDFNALPVDEPGSAPSRMLEDERVSLKTTRKIFGGPEHGDTEDDHVVAWRNSKAVNNTDTLNGLTNEDRSNPQISDVNQFFGGPVV